MRMTACERRLEPPVSGCKWVSRALSRRLRAKGCGTFFPWSEGDATVEGPDRGPALREPRTVLAQIEGCKSAVESAKTSHHFSRWAGCRFDAGQRVRVLGRFPVHAQLRISAVAWTAPHFKPFERVFVVPANGCIPGAGACGATSRACVEIGNGVGAQVCDAGSNWVRYRKSCSSKRASSMIQSFVCSTEKRRRGADLTTRNSR